MDSRPPFNTSSRVDYPRPRGRSMTPAAHGSGGRLMSPSATRARVASRPRPSTAAAVAPGGYAEQHARAAHLQQYGGSGAGVAGSAGMGGSGAAVAELRGMLHEIADVTRGIAQKIAAGAPSSNHQPPPFRSPSVGGAVNATGRARSGDESIDMSPQQGFASHHGQPATRLNPQEVERIVRRVESHFAAKLAEGQAIIEQQASLIHDLRRRLAADKHAYEERIEALTERIAGNVDVEALLAAQQQHQQRHADGSASPSTPTGVSGGAAQPPGGGVAAAVAIEQLKQLLQFEKRQRLQCEEQAQLMAEQHNRVVSTLEQRLRKQAQQIQDLTGASCGTPSNNGSLSVRQTPRSARLAQLQASSQMRRTGSGVGPADGVAAMAFGGMDPTLLGSSAGASLSSPSLGPSAPPPPPPPPHGGAVSAAALVPPIRGLPMSGGSSVTPPRRNGGVTSGAVATRGDRKLGDDDNIFGVEVSDRQLVPGNFLSAGASRVTDSSANDAAQAADDVASFLDTITRELDDINAVETERNAVIQRLI